MHIRCPHCQNPIDLVDDIPLKDIECPSCGSSFSLVSDDTSVTFIGDSQTIGHFNLVEHIGVGRFGSVWRATDTELDRTVAVKIPRSDQLNVQESESFFREARAAAQLKHPNIVPVHEVGRENDTIYIVSDFIQGANLKEWISAHALGFKEAAQLCTKLALAIHHAHEAGVVHRDLKPSNIMMDFDGEPHIMDFGLAKRESGEITMTMDGQILGTPAYMSPEQAGGESHQLDGRADVYSLGVILYELLTGELPFRGEKRMLIVQILKDDPPAPRKLNSKVPRDLETICLKCLEKEPQRRYQTAQELAEEFDRYLNHTPIVARPISRFGRILRWTKRKPAVASLSAAVVLTLLVGITVSTYFAIAENRALVELKSQKDEIENERDRADENLLLTRQVIDGLAVLAYDKRMKTPEARRIQVSMLEELANYYNSLVKRIEDKTDMKYMLAKVYLSLAGIKSQLGNPAKECLAINRKALSILQPLVDRFPDNVKFQRDLAGSLQNLGAEYLMSGQLVEADNMIRRSIDLQKILSKNSPDNLIYLVNLSHNQSNLATLSRYVHRLEKSRQLYEEAIRIQRNLVARQPSNRVFRDQLATTLYNLGVLYNDLKQTENSAKQYREALELQKKLLQEKPDFLDYRLSTAKILGGLAKTYELSGQFPDSEKAHLDARKILSVLATDYPQFPVYRADLALTLNNLASFYLQLWREKDAQKLLLESIHILQPLVRGQPEKMDYRRIIGAAYRNLSEVEWFENQPKKALEYASEAIFAYRFILERNPQSSAARYGLRSAYADRAVAHFSLGNRMKGDEDWKLSLELAGGTMPPNVLSVRAIAFAQAGEHDSAVLQAEELSLKFPENGAVMFHSSFAFAVSSIKVEKDSTLNDNDKVKFAEIYASKAISHLRKAQSLDYFQLDSNRNAINTLKFFDKFRNREDFQQLIREIETAAKAKPQIQKKKSKPKKQTVIKKKKSDGNRDKPPIAPHPKLTRKFFFD